MSTNEQDELKSITKFIRKRSCHSETRDFNINNDNESINLNKISENSNNGKDKFGVNETPPDYNLLNKRPKFSEEFENQIMRNISKQKRFDNHLNRFKLTVPEEDMVVKFESRFENANLKKAIKVSDTEYNLWLNFDFNTKGHTQWFYFKIMTKLPAGTTIQFRILNFMKPDSLYNDGMKP